MRRAVGGRHLPLGLLQVHDPRADRREAPLRNPERLAVALVEALGDVARELDVLTLVVADGHEIRLVQEDVAGHQGRIRKERGGHELTALGLVLELRHPSELPVARHR